MRVSELTELDVARIKGLLVKGIHQHRIAAMYDLNQGRISEIATGKRWPHIKPTVH